MLNVDLITIIVFVILFIIFTFLGTIIAFALGWRPISKISEKDFLSVH